MDEQDLEDGFGSFDEMSPEPLELPEEPASYTQRVVRRPIPAPKQPPKPASGPSIGSRLTALTKKIGGALTGAPAKKGHKRDQIPTKILQFSLVSRGENFTGEQVYTAAREFGLEYGEMEIFHYREGGRTLFSMANLVKPGTFPSEDAEEFATPGLLLFAQLPGPKDVMAVFSDMLSTADRLSKRLNAEIQDERHALLTRHTVENIREDLLEYRRQIQVLRNRR